MLKLTLPVAPSANSYKGYKIVYYGGKPVPQAYRTPIANEYLAYVKKIVKRELKTQVWEVPSREQYIVMDIVFYFDKKRKDADNAIKVMQDALMDSGLFIDDDVIMPRVKDIIIDRKNPRVELMLSVAPKLGLFKDEEHLTKFKGFVCDWCKKSTYKRPCGILQTALSNVVSEDIDIKNFECKEIKPL